MSGLFLLFGRVVLGGVLIVAAYPKIVRPDHFVFVVREYKILPSPLAPTLATTLPYAELLFGSFLIVGYDVKVAAMASTVMMATFMGAMASVRLRRLKVGCGCFGNRAQPIGRHEFLRDAVMLTASLAVYVWS